MKDISFGQPETPTNVQGPQRNGGVTILRDLEGHLCAHCGSLRYFLVFRVSGDGRNGILTARCSRCREARELTAGEIERESRAWIEQPPVGKNNRRIAPGLREHDA